MFKNEVVISKKDKERLISLIAEVNKILKKYPYSSDYSQNTVTIISRAKSFSKDAEEWIRYLEVEQ